MTYVVMSSQNDGGEVWWAAPSSWHWIIRKQPPGIYPEAPKMASRISTVMRRACRHPARSPASAMLGMAPVQHGPSLDLTSTTSVLPVAKAPFPFQAKAVISADQPRLARSFA